MKKVYEVTEKFEDGRENNLGVHYSMKSVKEEIKAAKYHARVAGVKNRYLVCNINDGTSNYFE